MKKLIKLLLVLLLSFSLFIPSQAQAKTSIVKQRIKEIKKIYPQNSRFNGTVSVTTMPELNDGEYTYWTLTECAGLVGYVTLKTFHLPYIPFGINKYYKRVGKASTKSTSAMKKLMKKAKIGDVVEFHSGKNHKHVAIYLTKYKSGIKVYEANFGPHNKVWYNHKWPYAHFKDWPGGGAKSVSIYRAINYSAVNKGTAAINLKKNSRITVDGITYTITSNSLKQGTAKVFSNPDHYKIPKYIAYNQTTSDTLVKLAKKYSPYTKGYYESLKYVSHYSKPEYIEDEQIFKVVK